MRPLTTALLMTLLLTLAQALAWLVMNPSAHAPDIHANPGEVAEGLAFSAYGRWDTPAQFNPHLALSDTVSETQLASDLQHIKPLTRNIRTYSALQWPALPRLAHEQGMNLALGIWLSNDAARNQAEIASAISAAQTSNAVNAIIVGNETQLQNRITLAQLMDALATVKHSVRQPVTTAEPWHVWLETPQLAAHVDFITIHLLPYWEGVPVEQAVDYVFERYRQVQQRFPDKRIVIGETGWPSGGPNRGKALANPNTQAQFIRHFLSRATELRPLPHNAIQTPSQPHRHTAPHQPAAAYTYAVQHTPAAAALSISQTDSSALSPLPLYFLMEAIDQPWKISIEGEAGAYWGMLDAQRQSKFNFAGPLQTVALWQTQAALACCLAALLCYVMLRKLGHLRYRAQLTVGVIMQLIAAGLALMLTQALAHYFTPTAWAVWVLMLVPTLLMALVLIVQTLEFADTFWDGQLRFAAQPRPWTAEMASSPHAAGHADHTAACAPITNQPPLVSIHVACSNEPPQMVIETVQSLLNLQWRNLEIIIIDNNTTDPACWMPVRDFLIHLVSQQLATGTASASSSASDCGSSYDLQVALPQGKVHFRHEARIAGFKAGALNLALQLTHPHAAWVAVVDADYVVHADWIDSVGGYFNTNDIDIIQAPQTHRISRNSKLEHMMCAEYDTFFRIGMHHRHERNAIIQHGTMTLIRASTLRKLDGWNTDCICEDTELGLRILATGARALYIDKPMGAGLAPADSQAYLRQRFRWACGAMQIMRAHGTLLARGQANENNPRNETNSSEVTAPIARRLTLAQRYHFIAGWLPWWGDTLHLFMTLAALAWTTGMLLAPQTFGAPTPFFMLAPVTLLAFRLIAGPLLYRRRVGGGYAQWGGAALAGMALSHTIAKGILRGLIPKTAVFEITAKSDHVRKMPTRARSRVFHQEALLMLLLLSLASLVWLSPASPGSDPQAQIAWLLMLVLQSLPYAATTALHLKS